jgi:AcrR family transcriptional regulator
MAGKKTKRQKRLPLTRERVLRAALALADDRGIEALSMRRLGQRLGVEAMALYKHVANKDEVLAGIVDIIVGDIDIKASGVSWQESMRSRAVSMRKVFACHPWALGLLESRRSFGPAALRYCDSVFGVLRQAGFSTVMAARAFSVLDSYAYGYSIQEQSLPSGSATEATAATEQFLQQVPGNEYPYLAETAASLLQSGFDFTKEFELGLDLILEALEAWRVRDEDAATRAAQSRRTMT